ncbi:MAG: 2Fe-2S iron-sulfur cluster binding domain-containing protein, partial [Gammaproteobacteria bacterium]|nr:2Fe-2S iron-sulfur cluster binding domain-containing protein [Gammaproteobacteria bacterium]
MGFSIDINDGKHVIEVGESETILDAALRQDIGLPYGCRNG